MDRTIALITVCLICVIRGFMDRNPDFYLSLGGLMDLEQTFRSDNEIEEYIYSLKTNVMLYYCEFPVGKHIIKKDASVTVAVLIQHSEDGEEFVHIISSIYTKRVFTIRELQTTDFEFEYEYHNRTDPNKKWWVLVLAHSKVILHIDLIRNKNFLKSPHVLKNTRYVLSAFIENIETGEVTRVLEMDKILLNGDHRRVIKNGRFNSGVREFFLQYNCKQDEGCSQRISPFKYQPKSIEIRFNHKNTFIWPEKPVVVLDIVFEGQKWDNSLKVIGVRNERAYDTITFTFFKTKEISTSVKGDSSSSSSSEISRTKKHVISFFGLKNIEFNITPRMFIVPTLENAKKHMFLFPPPLSKFENFHDPYHMLNKVPNVFGNVTEYNYDSFYDITTYYDVYGSHDPINPLLLLYAVVVLLWLLLLL